MRKKNGGQTSWNWFGTSPRVRKRGFIVLLSGCMFATFFALAPYSLRAGESKNQTKEESKLENLSFTVYPILLGNKPMKNVGEVVALLLERGGVKHLEIAENTFHPSENSEWEQITKEFAQFIPKQKIQTKYALYGEFMGTRETGVQEVRTVVVDAKGDVVWQDRQTPEDAAFQQTKPSNPMTCCVLMGKRLQDRFSLKDPLREDAPNGDMAERWREKSNVPPKEEMNAIEERLNELKKDHQDTSLTVYPVHVQNQTYREHTETLCKMINENNLFKAQPAKNAVNINVPGNSNEMRMLWDLAHAFREEVRKNPPPTDYTLYADYIMALPDGPVGGVHFVICDKKGEWVMVSLQNSHHENFQKIDPDSVEDCNRILVRQLEDEMDVLRLGEMEELQQTFQTYIQACVEKDINMMTDVYDLEYIKSSDKWGERVGNDLNKIREMIKGIVANKPVEYYHMCARVQENPGKVIVKVMPDLDRKAQIVEVNYEDWSWTFRKGSTGWKLIEEGVSGQTFDKISEK